jgi:hypothetical protein
MPRSFLASVSTLLDQNKLNTTDVRILRFLAEWKHVEGPECSLSNANLAAKIARSRDSVNLSLGKLTSLGLVTREENFLDRRLNDAKNLNRKFARVKVYAYKVDFEAVRNYCTGVDQCRVSPTHYVLSSYEDNTPRKVESGLRPAIDVSGGRKKEPINRDGQSTMPKAQSPRPSNQEANVSNNFGLAKAEPKKNRIQTLIEQSDRELAATLFAALKARGKVSKRYSLARWAEEFYRLRTQFGETEVRRVLTWYCDNIGGEYVTWSFSAAAFREDFPRIQSRMEQLARQRPEAEVTTEANEVARRVSSMGWPSEARDLIPVVAQKTMDAYKEYRRRLVRLKNSVAPTPGRSNTRLDGLRHLVAVGTSNEDFAESWLRRVFAHAFGFEETRAKLTNYVFSPSHKLFASAMKDEASPYGIKWDDLLEELTRA